MNIKPIILFIFIMLSQSGCASYLLHKSWATAKKESAIVISSDGSTSYVGVDIGALEYIKENWPLATVAAIMDGFAIYKGADIVKDELFDDENRRDTVVNIYGDVETININNR